MCLCLCLCVRQSARKSSTIKVSDTVEATGVDLAMQARTRKVQHEIIAAGKGDAIGDDGDDTVAAGCCGWCCCCGSWCLPLLLSLLWLLAMLALLLLLFAHVNAKEENDNYSWANLWHHGHLLTDRMWAALWGVKVADTCPTLPPVPPPVAQIPSWCLKCQADF